MSIFKQISGSKRQVRRVRRYLSGAWEEQQRVVVQVGSAQVPAYQTIVVLDAVALDSTSFQVSAHVDVTKPTTVFIYVATGTTMNNTNEGGVRTGPGWHEESRLVLINYGLIKSSITLPAIYLEEETHVEIVNHGTIGSSGSGDWLDTNGFTYMIGNNGTLIGGIS